MLRRMDEVEEKMRDLNYKLLACLLFVSMPTALFAQSGTQVASPASSSSADGQSAQLVERLEAVSSALTATHQQLEQSQLQIQRLQEELAQIRKQLANSQTGAGTSSSAGNTTEAAKAGDVSLEEREQTVEAQVKLHEQTKIESGSKYPVRFTGLILFNSFINKGVVDNIDLPEVALQPGYGVSNGSAGAGFRQTILGMEGNGPRVAGARTSGNVSLDFFGGLAYSSYGTSAGVVRMRTASVKLDWSEDSLQVGFVEPLISPLSPTSYATVAYPSMAGAGNLWTWAPQLKYAHRFPLQEGRRVQVELGLWDPPAAGYSMNSQLRSPSVGEQSKQPAYESRVSFGSTGEDHNFQIGLSGYYSRQSYPYGRGNDSWAGTADWRIPIASHFELSGEAYRGRSLGGLGGGVYKDVVYGTYPETGAYTFNALNAVGGWGQFKARFSQTLEANAIMGLDNGFSGDFHSLVLSPTAYATELRARNEMVVGNLIYRPKTYLIFSPEYRRIWTWPIYGVGNTADIFTLSVGYQF